MTPEETRKAIGVMQAYADGREIQCRVRGSSNPKWESQDGVYDWDWRDFEYRVKPEPREFWINRYDAAPRSVVHLTREDAAAKATHCRVECIHVREAMDHTDDA